MALTKPTTLPEFAKEDDANISEPITALKEDGWADEEIPTAKNWNWFSHWVNKWLAWINEIITPIQTVDYTFATNEFASTPPTGTISYQRIGSFLVLHFSEAIGLSGGTYPLILTIKKVGGGNFPSEFFPSSAFDFAQCLVGSGTGMGNIRPGSLLFISTSLDLIDVHAQPDSSALNHGIIEGGFEDGVDKGIKAQTIWLYRPLA